MQTEEDYRIIGKNEDKLQPLFSYCVAREEEAKWQFGAVSCFECVMRTAPL